MTRKTIVIESKNLTKLFSIQSKIIKEENKSISFSHVINLVIEEGLKHVKI